jgi:hypothetical protein
MELRSHIWQLGLSSFFGIALRGLQVRIPQYTYAPRWHDSKRMVTHDILITCLVSSERVPLDGMKDEDCSISYLVLCHEHVCCSAHFS